MNDYIEIHDNYDRRENVRFEPVQKIAFSRVMTRVYGWMTLALFITAITASYVAKSPEVLSMIFGNRLSILFLCIGEVALVMGLSWGINRISTKTAALLFIFYSVLNGLTMASIFFSYSLGTIYQAFAASALTFGAMSIFGATTKHDLSSLGGILFMALIGLVIASVINIFWSNSIVDTIITYCGVFIFVGLTAYDTQRIKSMSAAVLESGDATAIRRVSILGSLSLYLDFINLFLYILRLFGRGRD